MKQRLDVLLVERGLAESRERAKALIMEGKVLVGEVPATKAGTMVPEESALSLKEGLPYVSRGGLKLEAALEYFKVQVEGLAAMDVGSSTGGFTDCLLKRGARKIYCIDVGYGQLDWKLRNDPRIVLMEKSNIRHLEKNSVPEPIDIVTIDVSFISLKLVVPKVKEFLSGSGRLVALIKPQFEVGRADVGKGGLVKDESKRLAAVETISEHVAMNGFAVKGYIASPILGRKGNIEYLIYAEEEV
jgi:23S rRNA (cytidine1920-2'-O)/16S rRNA (cytidine1409-2'-O)-methyltransferase